MRAAFVLLLAIVACAGAAFQTASMGMKARGMLYMMDPGVKKELKITKEQDKKFQEGMKKMEADARSGNLAGMDFMNPFAPLDGILDGILDEAQKKRMEELFVQANGGHAVADKKVAEAMELTEEQKSQIDSIHSAAKKEMMESMMSARSTGAVKEAEKKWAGEGDKILALLDEKQKVKLEEMKGKPFKFKK